jgi:hypothetical protein
MDKKIFNSVTKCLDSCLSVVASAGVGYLLSQGVNKYVKELSVSLSPLNTAASSALFVVVDGVAYHIFRFLLNPRFKDWNDEGNDQEAQLRTQKPIWTAIRLGMALTTTVVLFNRFHSDFNRLNLIAALSHLETTVTPVVILTAVLGAKVIKCHLPWMNI